MIRSERGQALVETALTLPILIWALFGVIDLGIAFGRSVQLTNACREAARYGSIYPLRPSSSQSADPDNVKYVVKQRSYGIALADTNITVQYETNASPAVQYDATVAANSGYGVAGNSVRVTVTYSYTPIAPFVNVLFPNGAVSLSATSVTRIEQPHPSPTTRTVTVVPREGELSSVIGWITAVEHLTRRRSPTAAQEDPSLAT